LNNALNSLNAARCGKKIKLDGFVSIRAEKLTNYKQLAFVINRELHCQKMSRIWKWLFIAGKSSVFSCQLVNHQTARHQNGTTEVNEVFLLVALDMVELLWCWFC